MLTGGADGDGPLQARAAEAIHQAVSAGELAHRVALGRDARRRIGIELNELRAECEAGREPAFSTDFPGPPTTRWSGLLSPGLGRQPKRP
ncbi:hypothetical protein [Streptomyces sp. NBC_00009]|uniref:hypothetical protein n=1 Tax=Streptomyces sp. NBC_00009 TaxID=2975620 RepID=UPI00324F5484